MKKIKVSELPEDIQELFDGEDEIEFQSLIDPEITNLLTITQDLYNNDRLQSAKKLVAHRKYTQEMSILYKKYEEGKLTSEKAEKLMQQAMLRYQTNSFGG